MAQSNAQTMQRQAGRRRESRLRVRLHARLTTLDGTVSALLVNLAQRGARIEAPHCRVRPGQDAVLAWDRYEAFGTVMWNDGQFLGMSFDEPLRGSVVVATRDIHDSRMMPVEEQAIREAAQAFVNPRKV